MADEDNIPTEENSAELIAPNGDENQENGEETPQPSPSDATHPEEVRKSQRTRTLTEKGKVLQDSKINDLKRDFERLYKKWKYHINCFRRFMKGKDTELITEAVSAIDTFQSDICKTYDEIRKIENPDIEIRRKTDLSFSMTEVAKAKAQCLLELKTNPDECPWPDSGSVFETTSSRVSSGSTFKSKASSDVSKQSSLHTLQQSNKQRRM
ncbi:unnamed protein product [Knipowitschia caucasica]